MTNQVNPTEPSSSARAASTNPSPFPGGGFVPAFADSAMPIYPAEYIDLERFNALVGDEPALKWVGKPVEDIRRLFVKRVILDDETSVDVETVKVPGFIGVSDDLEVIDPHGDKVSGHADITKFLQRDGLLICTFQWNKERYGIPIDTRQQIPSEIFIEAFIKNEAHHAGALVPAQRFKDGELISSFAALNESDSYHDGMYGKDGFVTVAQRLVFPDFVSPQQARGYIDSIVSWMALLNPFAQFPQNYNGGDPTRIGDRATLRDFMRNGLLAALGDLDAVRFFKDPTNKTYCAEFMYICLNTPVYPFNKRGLTALLDGDDDKADQILAIQRSHNNREKTVLSGKTDNEEFERILARNPGNPEFQAFNIPMPVVPEALPQLDELLAQHGQSIEPNSLPLPPFKISQIIRQAFKTMLPPRQFSGGQESSPQHRGLWGGILAFFQSVRRTILSPFRRKVEPEATLEGFDKKLADAQVRLLTYIEPALRQQLDLQTFPDDDPKVQAVRQFVQFVNQQLQRPFKSYAEFDAVIDGIMAEVDKRLVAAGDRARFVPPRVFLDWGQNGRNDNLPQGWGFKLETVGALVSRRVISPPGDRLPLEYRDLKLTDPMLKGDDVQVIQGALLRAGIDIKPDGFFGPGTDKALKQFQEQNGLEPNGVVTRDVRIALGLL
ncbi:MAG TPA: peptidoglycan-binding domain-containing protein [Elainellaceae cyanobacterium]